MREGDAPAIMIVEDEALIAILLERQLRRLGYPEVDKTASGEEAVRLSQGRSYDLVLMDIHLSKAMSGIDTARTLRDQGWTGSLAFMTAFGDQGSREAAARLSPLAFLEKPVGLETLRAILDGLKRS